MHFQKYDKTSSVTLDVLDNCYFKQLVSVLNQSIIDKWFRY